MSEVYKVVFCFERSLRAFIVDRMHENHGEHWWVDQISEKIKKNVERRQKDEASHRYHGARGAGPVNFTQLDDLLSILRAHEQDFIDLFPNIDWVEQIIKSLTRSRNVIMHAGELSVEDVNRVGQAVRDWIRQTNQ